MTATDQAAGESLDLTSLKAALDELVQRTRAPAMDPDPTRSDWATVAAPITAIRTIVDQRVLAPVEAMLERHAQDPELTGVLNSIRQAAADLVGDAAALLFASGLEIEARAWIERAAKIGADQPAGVLLADARQHPARFARLIRAWWLMHQGPRRFKEAQRVAAELVKDDAWPAIVASARVILAAQKPLEKAPTLFTLNGCGVRMYGERDLLDDGSYVSTRFATLVFLPLFPIDAFRVAPGEDGGWYFLARAPLSRVARVWRYAAAGLFALLLISWATESYRNSPDRRLEAAIAAVAEDEARADDPAAREAVLSRYEEILTDYPEASTDAARPALEAVVRLASADLPDPLTLAAISSVKRIVRRFESLPLSVRSGPGSRPMVDRLIGWADQLGDADEAALEGQLRLLADAARLAVNDAERRDDLSSKTRAIQLRLAGMIEREWPLAAIERYAEHADDPSARAAAAALIDALDNGPSVWIELAPAIERWAARAAGTEQAASAERAMARLAAAREALSDPRRLEALVSTDPEVVTAALTPGDQEVAVALAGLWRAQGDDKAALAVLEALGPPGRMVTATQLMLASVLADGDELARAEALLQRILRHKLPAFEQARAAYDAAATKLQTALVERGKAGDLPQELIRALEGAPESEQPTIFGAWVGEQLSADPEINALREAYLQRAEVVPVALQLGLTQLRQANATTGDHRQELLTAAEQTFLSIQGEAEGVPTFHLGLGQVYHRLGKKEEGEQEFAQLLASDDPELKLGVASAYRELGLEARAREVATAVFESAPTASRQQAATILALLADDRVEKKRWLAAGDPNSPFVQEALLSIEAAERFAEGDLAGADARYAEVLERQLANAKTDVASANNAALTMGRRYLCTGRTTFVDESVAALDAARSLDPDNALLVGNLAHTLDYQAALKLLSPWIDTERLPLSPEHASTLLSQIAAGPSGEAMRRAIRESATVRRSIDLHRQESLLAPGRASAYLGELDWYINSRDVDGVRLLRARLESIDGFDTSASARARERWMSGEDDEELREEIDQQLARLDRAEKQGGRRLNAATHAAILSLRGDTLRLRASLDDSVESLAAATHAYAQAREVWPAIGVEGDLVQTGLMAIIHRARERSPELTDLWERERRRLGAHGVLLTLATKAAPAAAINEALRADQELANVIELARTVDVTHGKPVIWALAVVAEESTLEAAARAGLESEYSAVAREIAAVLDPESPIAVIEKTLPLTSD
ncbi:MAG: hypothetical protein KC636_19300 [Myxococcales bacterium]|nr:hypothetical protein [Myxococcales bacterium]